MTGEMGPAVCCGGGGRLCGAVVAGDGGGPCEVGAARREDCCVGDGCPGDVVAAADDAAATSDAAGTVARAGAAGVTVAVS